MGERRAGRITLSFGAKSPFSLQSRWAAFSQRHEIFGRRSSQDLQRSRKGRVLPSEDPCPESMEGGWLMEPSEIWGFRVLRFHPAEGVLDLVLGDLVVEGAL